MELLPLIYIQTRIFIYLYIGFAAVNAREEVVNPNDIKGVSVHHRPQRIYIYHSDDDVLINLWQHSASSIAQKDI